MEESSFLRPHRHVDVILKMLLIKILLPFIHRELPDLGRTKISTGIGFFQIKNSSVALVLIFARKSRST